MFDPSEPSKAVWRTSSFSNAGGNCVQVAVLNDNLVATRDSKAPGNGVLVFPREWFACLIRKLASG